VLPFHSVKPIESVLPGSPLSDSVIWKVRPPASEIGLSGSQETGDYFERRRNTQTTAAARSAIAPMKPNV